MLKICLLLLSLISVSNIVAAETVDKKVLKLAMLGFGCRAQDILYNCLKEAGQDRAIEVVAICDNNTQESSDCYINALLKRRQNEVEETRSNFKRITCNASYYPDTEQGLQELFKKHRDLDKIIIASSNDRHLLHLEHALKLSNCKDVFIEKPIFRNLKEFAQFNADLSDRNVYVGLVLRYAAMAEIAAELLAEHKNELGQLQKIRSWEHVNFAHALTIIMMNWRRFKDQSGGLLIEKSVHDLDLALFFMQAVDEEPCQLVVTTETSHEFFKKSRHQEILARLSEDQELREKADRWDNVAFQRIIPFYRDAQGAIDWQSIMKAFFKDFPEDDALQDSNIIPDRHTIQAIMQTTKGSTIDFELQVKLNDFAKITERGTHFVFEHGDVIIDIEKGKMRISKKGASDAQEFDLKVNNASHGGGDKYVAQTILGTLPEGHTKAMFNDLTTQLSTLLGLVSEDQAVRNTVHPARIAAVNGKWTIQG